MDKTDRLLEDILLFLRNERALYGDWGDPAGSAGSAAGPAADTHRSEESPSAGMPVNDSSDKPDPDPPGEPAGSSSGAASNILTGRCKTLSELEELCSSADVLRTDLKDTNLVFGTGNPDADLMVVGEAPGYHEDRQGEPFVGRAGKLLDKILAAIQFSRDNVYIANILKHRPPENRNPTPEERASSLPYLTRQIELVDPKLILCLGRVSGTTLLDREDSLKNLRGQFHPFMGRLLMVTYHPAALLRNPVWKRPAWEDVRMLREKYDELS
ncbi:MAG: uracil-DNA glycosylase [Balneolaceae bacterium]